MKLCYVLSVVRLCPSSEIVAVRKNPLFWKWQGMPRRVSMCNCAHTEFKVWARALNVILYDLLIFNERSTHIKFKRG